VGGRVKVGDFGLVRDVCAGTDTLHGGLSPAYASPESFTGDVSRYSDQYSLAIVYQEMLTGTRPFRGRNTIQLSEQHLHGVPNLQTLSPCDKRVIARALSKDPNDRYPSCSDMVRALIPREDAETPKEDHDSAPPAGGGVAIDTPRGDAEPTSSGTLVSALMTAERGPTRATTPTSRGSGDVRVTSSTISELCDVGAENTLFIGIGGIAGRTLRHLRRLVQSRLGQAPGLRRFGWLLLDTDRRSLEELTRPDDPGHWHSDEVVPMPLHEPRHYQPGLKELRLWLERSWVFRIPRTKTTGGIRPLGRLALVDNAALVLARLRQAIQSFVPPGEKPHGAADVRVVIVASVSGGTGGGCVADVALVSRRLLAEQHVEGVSIETHLILASDIQREQKELARANSFATLMELDHFLRPGSQCPSEKALGLGPGFPSGPLFDAVRLADLGDIDCTPTLESRAQILADYLYLDRATPFGRKRRSVERVEPRFASGPRIATFRLARYGFPRAELTRVVAEAVCRRLIVRWLDGTSRGGASLQSDTNSTDPPDPVRAAAAEAERFFDQTNLDDDRFLELFWERVERATGSDPMKLYPRMAREALLAKRGGIEEIMSGLLDQLDEIVAAAPADGDRKRDTVSLEQRMHDEFKYDGTSKQHQLDLWVKGILENPAQRLKPAAEAVQVLSDRLARERQAIGRQVRELRERRRAIRQRFAVRWNKSLVVSLVETARWREKADQWIDEFAEYVQLRFRELALDVRAKLLDVLRTKAAIAAAELVRIGDGLRQVEMVFEVSAPRLRHIECWGSACPPQSSSSSARIRILSDGPSTLRVTVTPHREPGLLVTLTVMLLLWGVGALAVASWVIALPAILLCCHLDVRPEESCRRFFDHILPHWPTIVIVLLAWLPPWIIFGYVLARVWFFTAWGREEITLYDNYMIISTFIFRKPSTRHYQSQMITDIRFSPEMFPIRTLTLGRSWRMFEILFGLDRGSIGFEYGGQTHRFGIALPEDDARFLIAAVVQQLSARKGTV
jgi:hypothetical protein